MEVKNFKLKSFLFVPAIKDKYFSKILTLDGPNKPDAIIFDLEDSVHVDFKVEARKKLLDFTKKHLKDIKKKYIICLRINKFDTPYLKEDLKIVDRISPNFIMLPKVESSLEFISLRKKIKKSKFIVLIETIDGLYNLEKITNQMNSCDILAVGPEDFSAQLLIERPEYIEPSPLWYFYSECLLRARKNNLALLDGPSRKFVGKKAVTQLGKECLFSLRIGFNCKMAIHPNQIATINKIFNKDKIINKAEKFIKEFDNLKNGSSVILNSGKEMMDTPSYKMYQKIISFLKK